MASMAHLQEVAALLNERQRAYLLAAYAEDQAREATHRGPGGPLAWRWIEYGPVGILGSTFDDNDAKPRSPRPFETGQDAVRTRTACRSRAGDNRSRRGWFRPDQRAVHEEAVRLRDAAEVRAMLDAPDPTTRSGIRDRAMLHNSA